MFRKLLEWRFDIEAVMRSQALQHLEIELVTFVPALDGAGGERDMRKRHHAFGVEKADGAQTVALGTGTHRIVERKQARLQLLQCVIALRAGKLGGKQLLA